MELSESEWTMHEALASMPVVVADLQLHCDRVVSLPVRRGATLATSLRGTLLRHFARRACRAAGSCAGSDPWRCADPQGCDATWLIAPRSLAQRRDHASPITLTVQSSSERVIALRAVIWGRRATAQRAAILAAFADAGASGLIAGAHRVRWTAAAGPVHASAVGALVRATAPARLGASIVGVTRLAQGDRSGFAPLIADVAHDLTQFALADCGLDQGLGKAGCDAIADRARAEVLAAQDQVDIRWQEVRAANVGARLSRRNGHRFELSGTSASIALSGRLESIAPWLAAAGYWGIGGRKSFGMGRIRYFTESGAEWPSGGACADMHIGEVADVEAASAA